MRVLEHRKAAATVRQISRGIFVALFVSPKPLLHGSYDLIFLLRYVTALIVQLFAQLSNHVRSVISGAINKDPAEWELIGWKISALADELQSFARRLQVCP